MPTVSDIITQLDQIAPPHLAETGDPIGLHVGSRTNEVRKVRVCVDTCPRVVDAALAQGADLIVSHHPLIYTPLKSITDGDPVAGTAAKLVRANASLFALHTNFDSAPGGINDALASRLGLRETVVMVPRALEQFYKIVVFVPEEALDQVRDIMAEAGAGVIGNYTCCSYRTLGAGTFVPNEQAQPYIGNHGSLEEVEEYRLEMLCSESRREAVIAALLAAHPYEEPAYDIYLLANQPTGGQSCGFGRVGNLPEPASLADFAAFVRGALQLAHLKLSGDPDKLITRVAVMGGGGSGYYPDAIRLGAEVYVTGDTKHHDILTAEALGLAMIDAGHFETERPGVIELAARLSASFPEVEVAYIE
jgi:dinuclear metal center YbgI/SA1388 family protein